MKSLILKLEEGSLVDWWLVAPEDHVFEDHAKRNQSIVDARRLVPV